MRLIDADVLIEKFNEKCDMSQVLVDNKTAERFHTFCVIVDAVEDAPTVDTVSVAQGHWEGDGQCSVCLEYPLGRYATYKNFCPNCGAHMNEVIDNGNN